MAAAGKKADHKTSAASVAAAAGPGTPLPPAGNPLPPAAALPLAAAAAAAQLALVAAAAVTTAAAATPDKGLPAAIGAAAPALAAGLLTAAPAAAGAPAAVLDGPAAAPSDFLAQMTPTATAVDSATESAATAAKAAAGLAAAVTSESPAVVSKPLGASTSAVKPIPSWRPAAPSGAPSAATPPAGDDLTTTPTPASGAGPATPPPAAAGNVADPGLASAIAALAVPPAPANGPVKSATPVVAAGQPAAAGAADAAGAANAVTQAVVIHAPTPVADMTLGLGAIGKLTHDVADPAAGSAALDGAATAQLNATSAATPAAGTAPAGVFKLEAGLQSPELPQALADRVTWMAGNHLNGATLLVNPPQLGPIELRVSVDAGRTQVWLSAHNPATCDALQATSPKLREMLNSQGFAQVSVDVSQRSFQDRSAYSQNTQWTPPAERSDGAAGPAEMAAVSLRAPAGALDAYA